MTATRPILSAPASPEVRSDGLEQIEPVKSRPGATRQFRHEFIMPPVSARLENLRPDGYVGLANK